MKNEGSLPQGLSEASNSREMRGGNNPDDSSTYKISEEMKYGGANFQDCYGIECRCGGLSGRRHLSLREYGGITLHH